MYYWEKERSYNQYNSIIIQKYIRSYLQFIRYRRIKVAALVLQCHIRRLYAERVVYEYRKQVVTLWLQSYIKMSLVRKLFLSYKSKIIKIQCRYRCKVARAVLRKLKIDARSINTLQKSIQQIKRENEQVK